MSPVLLDIEVRGKMFGAATVLQAARDPRVAQLLAEPFSAVMMDAVQTLAGDKPRTLRACAKGHLADWAA